MAAVLYNQMAAMAFGHFSEEILNAVMDNFINLGKEAEQFQRLIAELNKRLFEGVDKKKIEEYNSATKEMSREEVQTAYPEIFPLVQKQKKVIESLRDKMIEVELTLVDKKEFVKGVLLGNPDIKAGVFNAFSVMFTEDEQEKSRLDMSELDELMN